MCEHDDELSKEFLKQRFQMLETSAHPIYALLAGLPKDNFFICRSFSKKENKYTNGDMKNDAFTMQEFFARYDDFHEEDTFRISLFVCKYPGGEINNIYDLVPNTFSDFTILDKDDFDATNFETFIDDFLEVFCERCLRENHPFELTAETISRFGFTPDDVAALGPMLDRNNASARKTIRKEYDALARLDFIRNSTDPE